MLRVCFFVALTILVETGSSAQTAEWAWVRSVSTGTAWWTTEGKATVTTAAGKFEAHLYDEADPTFLRLTIRGSTAKGVTTARVRVEASDVEDFEVSGRLRRFCWSTKGGRELLLLGDGAQVIGLVRELSASMPCTPA